MKEASWDDCIFSNSSMKITPDKEKAKSLIETAKDSIEKAKKLFKGLKTILDEKMRNK